MDVILGCSGGWSQLSVIFYGMIVSGFNLAFIAKPQYDGWQRPTIIALNSVMLALGAYLLSTRIYKIKNNHEGVLPQLFTIIMAILMIVLPAICISYINQPRCAYGPNFKDDWRRTYVIVVSSVLMTFAAVVFSVKIYVNVKKKCGLTDSKKTKTEKDFARRQAEIDKLNAEASENRRLAELKVAKEKAKEAAEQSKEIILNLDNMKKEKDINDKKERDAKKNGAPKEVINEIKQEGKSIGSAITNLAGKFRNVFTKAVKSEEKVEQLKRQLTPRQIGSPRNARRIPTGYTPQNRSKSASPAYHSARSSPKITPHKYLTSR